MLLHAIAARRAVRAYTAAPVSDSDLTDVLKAAQFAPTSRDNRSVQFVVIKDAETKKKIFDIAGQEFLVEAPVLIVPVTDPAKSTNAVQDLSLASQNIFLQATELGLGTVWKNLTKDQSIAIKEVLGIPSTLLLINIIPLGHPAETPLPHDDREFDTGRIHGERW